jgi:hypothetical protein
VLRQAQHEREIFSIPQSPSVHPELVEGFFNSFLANLAHNLL